MSTYLQRLYDGGLASPGPTAQPTQRSSSPLVALDQRLASSAYVTSFALGLPGDPGADPFAEPVLGDGWAMESDLPVAPRPTLRTPAPEVPPPSTPVRGPRARSEGPSTSERSNSDTSQGPHRVQVPQMRQPTLHHAPELPQPEPVVPRPEPAGRSAVDPEREPAVPWVRVAQPPAPSPPGTAVDAAPARAQLPAEPGRPATDVPDAPAPVTARPRKDPSHETRQWSTPGPASLLRPPPLAQPQHLPPVPETPRWSDLADQVRRLVREEVAAAAPSPAPSREPEPAVAGGPDVRRPRPSTAEAASVIGPLDRPPRTTTLYGLRLR